MGKGKKQTKNKPSSKKYKKYTVKEDGTVSRSKICPRCGPGTFLLNSNERLYCGKCHYSEFQNKSSEEK